MSALADDPEDLQPREARHHQVENQHIGLQRFDQPDALQSVTRLANDGEIRLGFQQGLHSPAYHRMIIRQDDGYGH